MRKLIHPIIIFMLLLTGVVLSGIAYGDFPDSLNVGDLKPGQWVTITFKVPINTDIQPHIEGISNQGMVYGLISLPCLRTIRILPKRTIPQKHRSSRSSACHWIYQKAGV